MAGHSLGEYTAAAAAGVVATSDGMEIVCERGRLMAAIQAERPGAMAAIVGIPLEPLRALCEQASSAGLVTPANLNTPTQIVVSGEAAGVEKFLELARAAGAEKAVRLTVGAGFHTALMKPVQARLRGENGQPYVERSGGAAGRERLRPVAGTGAEIRAALLAQIAEPGPVGGLCLGTSARPAAPPSSSWSQASILTGLVRQVNPEAEVFAADAPRKIDTFLQNRAAANSPATVLRARRSCRRGRRRHPELPGQRPAATDSASPCPFRKTPRTMMM